MIICAFVDPGGSIDTPDEEYDYIKRFANDILDKKAIFKLGKEFEVKK